MADKQTLTATQPSFSAGEISPLLYGRVDLDKYKVALALARNCFVDYRGGLSNRPGTQFVAQCKAVAGRPRLLPFIVSTESAYIIEVGNEYFRFVFNGGQVVSGLTPIEIATPYLSVDIPLLKYTQSADILTISNNNYAPQNLSQTGPSTFVLDPLLYGPGVSPPPSATATQIGGGTNSQISYAYVVTAVSSDGKEESLPTLPAVTPGGATLNIGDYSTATATASIYNRISWPASPSAPAYYKVYKVGPFKSTSAGVPEPMPSVFGYIGQSISQTFIDNDIAADYSQTPPQYQDPFSPGQLAQIQVSGGTGYSGNYVTLSFSGGGGTGAAGYLIIDPSTGIPDSVVLTNPGKNYMTAPTVVDAGPNNAIYTVTLGQITGTYPACGTYFQQRLALGGTDNFPEATVLSQPGKYNNFDTSAIVSASDSITFSIASTKNNTIKSYQPMSTGLIVFTTGSAFLVTGGGQGTAVTSASIVALPQASFGANDLPPIPINYNVLYCENRGATIRDLQFNFYYQNYVGTDRSVLSSHLFTGYNMQEWAFAEALFRQLQIVRSDGELLVMAYVPEQEIFGWTHYDTFGTYISVATIPEGNADAVYYIVERNIAGNVVFYIERQASRQFFRQENAWFLDCALQLPETFPNAVLTISGDNEIGETLNFSASAAVFSSANVGDTLWGNVQGKAVITAYINSTRVEGLVYQPFATIPNDPNNTVEALLPNFWTLDTPVTEVSGLDHLTGMMVSALADGIPVPAQLCVAGAITLPEPASRVIAGLSYQSQVETLRLSEEATGEGKRKNIPAVTLRVDSTLGLQMGPDFDHLTPMKATFGPYTPPPPLVSGDVRTLITSVWKKDGQVCFQQDDPLPFTILAYIPEVVAGDTYR